MLPPSITGSTRQAGRSRCEFRDLRQHRQYTASTPEAGMVNPDIVTRRTGSFLA
jgi:hypothetical protein